MVHRQKIKNNDHPKQVVNNCWDMISQELINGGLNDGYWSFILMMDTFSIVSINSVTFACCKLFSVKTVP